MPPPPQEVRQISLYRRFLIFAALAAFLLAGCGESVVPVAVNAPADSPPYPVGKIEKADLQFLADEQALTWEELGLVHSRQEEVNAENVYVPKEQFEGLDEPDLAPDFDPGASATGIPRETAESTASQLSALTPAGWTEKPRAGPAVATPGGAPVSLAAPLENCTVVQNGVTLRVRIADRQVVGRAIPVELSAQSDTLLPGRGRVNAALIFLRDDSTGDVELVALKKFSRAALKAGFLLTANASGVPSAGGTATEMGHLYTLVPESRAVAAQRIAFIRAILWRSRLRGVFRGVIASLDKAAHRVLASGARDHLTCSHTVPVISRVEVFPRDYLPDENDPGAPINLTFAFYEDPDQLTSRKVYFNGREVTAAFFAALTLARPGNGMTYGLLEGVPMQGAMFGAAINGSLTVRVTTEKWGARDVVSRTITNDLRILDGLVHIDPLPGGANDRGQVSVSLTFNRPVDPADLDPRVTKLTENPFGGEMPPGAIEGGTVGALEMQATQVAGAPVSTIEWRSNEIDVTPGFLSLDVGSFDGTPFGLAGLAGGAVGFNLYAPMECEVLEPITATPEGEDRGHAKQSNNADNVVYICGDATDVGGDPTQIRFETFFQPLTPSSRWEVFVWNGELLPPERVPDDAIQTGNAQPLGTGFALGGPAKAANTNVFVVTLRPVASVCYIVVAYCDDNGSGEFEPDEDPDHRFIYVVAVNFTGGQFKDPCGVTINDKVVPNEMMLCREGERNFTVTAGTRHCPATGVVLVASGQSDVSVAPFTVALDGAPHEVVFSAGNRETPEDVAVELRLEDATGALCDRFFVRVRNVEQIKWRAWATPDVFDPATVTEEQRTDFEALLENMRREAQCRFHQACIKIDWLRDEGGRIVVGGAHEHLETVDVLPGQEGDDRMHLVDEEGNLDRTHMNAIMDNNPGAMNVLVVTQISDPSNPFVLAFAENRERDSFDHGGFVLPIDVLDGRRVELAALGTAAAHEAGHVLSLRHEGASDYGVMFWRNSGDNRYFSFSEADAMRGLAHNFR
ncbi:MAG: hypothetical protein HY719_14470 [Planctomycetes bacterium]|nr:hypothetical protein [Planctomycetota bacterium]